MEILIIMGISLWVIGFIRVGRTIKDGLLLNETFVRPHFLIYLVCGSPKSQNIPPGSMAIPSLFLQLHGLLLIIDGLITVLVTQNIIFVGGFYVLGVVLIIIYILALYKSNSFKMDTHTE